VDDDHNVLSSDNGPYITMMLL